MGIVQSRCLDLVQIAGHAVAAALQLRARLDQALEARVRAQRIKHGIESKQRRCERHASGESAIARYRKYFLQRLNGAVWLTEARAYSRQNLERLRAVRSLSLDRIQGHGALDHCQRFGFVIEASGNEREIIEKRPVLRLFLEKGLQFAARVLPGLPGPCPIASDFLRPAQPKTKTHH